MSGKVWTETKGIRSGRLGTGLYPTDFNGRSRRRQREYYQKRVDNGILSGCVLKDGVVHRVQYLPVDLVKLSRVYTEDIIGRIIKVRRTSPVDPL